MKNWFSRDDDLNDELRAHLDMATRDRIASGESPAEARANARRELGNELLIKETTRAVWGWSALERIVQDLRYALRQMRRDPGFTALVILTLALGLGATTAMFAVVESVLLRPLPIDQPDRLVRIYELFPPNMGRGSVSVPNLRDIEAQAKSLSLVQAYSFGNFNLRTATGTERVAGVQIGARMFELLGVQPLLGRTFRTGEDRPEAEPTALLSERLWRRSFSADAAVLGRSITLDNRAYTVAGVMPASFGFPLGTSLADIYIPLRPTPQQEQQRGNHYLSVLARLRPGIDLAAARADMRGIAAELGKLYAGQDGRDLAAIPIVDTVLGGVGRTLWTLMGAVTLVLLIACVNVSNLLLARSTVRHKEVLIRAALGAGRWRIVRQFLVESLLLAACGGACGLLLASWGVRALAATTGLRLPRLAELQVDTGVFVFLSAITVLSALIFGVAPAWRAARSDPRGGLQTEPGRGLVGGRQRLRSTLVAAEVALVLVLLTGAGLLLRSFLTLRDVDPGLRAEGVLTLQVSLPRDAFAPYTHMGRFLDPVRDRVLALPGVTAAGWINALPMQTSGINGDFYIVGRGPLEPKDAPLAEFREVSPGYFEALGIPVLKGRALDARETPESQPVVMVNQALADLHFTSDGDTVGRRLRVNGIEAEIVGVAGSVRQVSITASPQPEIYTPVAQWAQPPAQMVLAVRTTLAPESLAPAIRGLVAEVDAGVPVSNMQTMQEVVARSFSDRSLYTLLLGLFAAIALVLASAGIYGVLSFVVSQRIPEIGLRLALGASTSGVIRMVIGGALKPVLAGVVAGAAGALAASRLIESLLFQVPARDAGIFAAVCLTIVSVALLASLLPARRAASVDPAVALRNE